LSSNPEIGRSVVAGGIHTNYHDEGSGPAVLLIHGSGPGVTAWANWRLTIPALTERFRVIAPDMVGFGFTERPPAVQYRMDTWVGHVLGLLDALDIGRAHVVGNSFGGALALALAIRAPGRVGRLVLMGSAGVRFALTEGLDKAWGYTPSIANMRELLDIFAADRTLVTDELARLRYEASVRAGCQEAFASMFPAPRQRWVDALASDESEIRRIGNETLIVHGREDRVIPLSSSYRLLELIDRAQLHVFGRCGHWTQIEHAARFNRLVSDFLAGQ
jgi:2-hydroxymuconate-semialdehyde hydrolase